jgi:hypothetical protein
MGISFLGKKKKKHERGSEEEGQQQSIISLKRKEDMLLWGKYRKNRTEDRSFSHKEFFFLNGERSSLNSFW